MRDVTIIGEMMNRGKKSTAAFGLPFQTLMIIKAAYRYRALKNYCSLLSTAAAVPGTQAHTHVIDGEEGRVADKIFCRQK